MLSRIRLGTHTQRQTYIYIQAHKEVKILHMLYTSRAVRWVCVCVSMWHWVQRNSLQHCAYPASFTRFHSSIISRIIILSALCPRCLTSTGTQGGTTTSTHVSDIHIHSECLLFRTNFTCKPKNKTKIVFCRACMCTYRHKALLGLQHSFWVCFFFLPTVVVKRMTKWG